MKRKYLSYMDHERLRARWETLGSEGLKTAAELSLHGLAKNRVGCRALELLRGGERVYDERLHTKVAGITFENPVMVGAGWDKKGRAVDGLYILGFSGVEVGSVLVHPQKGNPRPRLFIDKETKSVGLNRLGFNSVGMEDVADYLEMQRCHAVVGISIGKNKLTPDMHAPWAHAAVAQRLKQYARYFVINVSSPNTPGLRSLQNKEPLTDIVVAVVEVAGDIPVFVKTSPDLSREDLDDVIQVALDNRVRGLIPANTTIDESIKAKYGWQGQMGGVSGNDPEFRRMANEQMAYITRETCGTGLQRIGAGGINSAETAIERIEAGAQIIQVVTAIREKKTTVARDINRGILEKLEREGLDSVEQLIGTAI